MASATDDVKDIAIFALIVGTGLIVLHFFGDLDLSKYIPDLSKLKLSDLMGWKDVPGNHPGVVRNKFEEIVDGAPDSEDAHAPQDYSDSMGYDDGGNSTDDGESGGGYGGGGGDAL